MKKRICYIVQEYYPKDARVRKYVNLVIENGYQADIICLKRENDLKFESHENYNIYRTGLPKKRGGLFRYLFEYLIFFISASWLVSKLYFKRNYRVIHINNLPDFLVFSAFIPKLFGAKILLDMHEITPEFFSVKYDKSLKSKFIRLLVFIEKYSLRYADYIITVTKRIEDIFIKRARLKNNIDVILNVPELPSGTIAKKINFSEKFNIVYHGTITGLYNISEILYSISIIKDKIPHLKYHIYGEGEGLDELKELTISLKLKDIVIFHGHVEHSVMIKELGAMDLGILPMRRNIFIDLSFSNKIAEYTSLGIPVISSALPSVMDYYSSESLFYIDDDAEDFSNIILEVFSDEKNAQKKALSAINDYAKINWSIMSKKYLELLELLIK